MEPHYVDEVARIPVTNGEIRIRTVRWRPDDALALDLRRYVVNAADELVPTRRGLRIDAEIASEVVEGLRLAVARLDE